MNKELLHKVLLPLGVVLLLVGTLFLVKCDIDHAQRDSYGNPIHSDLNPPAPPANLP